MAKEYKDLVVGLDIGTSKVMAVVAEVQADLRLRATATNAVSSTTGYSGKTSLVGGFAPTVTSMTMTGSVYVGSAVRVNPNVQGGPIPQEVYQWQWSIDGAEWRDIDGATATTYSPVAGDVGHRLRMRILAINPLGMKKLVPARRSISCSTPAVGM